MMKDWYDIYIDEIKLKKDIIGYVDYKIRNKKKLINLINLNRKSSECLLFCITHSEELRFNLFKISFCSILLLLLIYLNLQCIY